MEFRTGFDIKPSKSKISYKSKIALTGSCFSNEIGAKFNEGKMDALVSPNGVLYNPQSVADSLRMVLQKKEFTRSDLYFFNNKYLSFYHDTGFSGPDPDQVLNRINEVVISTYRFLEATDFLFITFGTARAYKWVKTGKIISNCHKIPSGEFTRLLMTTDEIISLWTELIEDIYKINNKIKIVFTVSPVRHLKDGAHGNQLSKSILHLAIHDILGKDDKLSYFPSYELMLDDLRDYRFYNKDMVHPSAVAVDYIWDRFMDCYFDKETVDIYKSVRKITEARGHRTMTDNKEDIERFNNSVLVKIASIEKKYPFINMEEEKNYFQRP